MDIGIVVRDFAGEIIAAFNNSNEHVASPKIAEIIALKRAMIFCTEIGLQNVIFEGDAKVIIEEINSTETCWATYGHLVEEIKRITNIRDS